MSANILLRLSYDGTDFVGWQRQPSSHGMSVQQLLEDSLSNIYGERIGISGAGRTDAGVHAFGACCNFRSSKPVPVEKLPLILNNLLPAAVRVHAAQAVDDAFHARFSACGKHYRYVIEQQAQALAFGGRDSWQLQENLDVAAMQQGAAFLLGEHDFRHYTVSGCSVKDFVRRIDTLEVRQEDDFCGHPWQQLSRPIVIDVVGNGFLYKMVRIIVGRLVAVGRGEIVASQMADYIDGSFDKNIPPAPPRGLMLMKVFYPQQYELNSDEKCLTMTD